MENNFNLGLHESFMSRALELARKGRGKVSPNPMVGCVLVKNGEIIGEGYHEEFGGPHAEVMAIRNARMDPVDSVAYVNLEPCCIMGKTPPCTTTLKENGISEVYIGILDSNEEVNGKGVDKLEKFGIMAHVGILENESTRLNQGFHKWITRGLPFVIAKVAQSADGYMGMNSDTSMWITGDASKRHTHALRSQVDAILIGKQTAFIDNPSLTVREVLGQNPIRVILDSNRTLPLSLEIFNDKKAENIVFCSANRFTQSQTYFCKYIPVKEKNNRLSPLHILKFYLHDQVIFNINPKFFSFFGITIMTIFSRFNYITVQSVNLLLWIDGIGMSFNFIICNFQFCKRKPIFSGFFIRYIL